MNLSFNHDCQKLLSGRVNRYITQSCINIKDSGLTTFNGIGNQEIAFQKRTPCTLKFFQIYDGIYEVIVGLIICGVVEISIAKKSMNKSKVMLCLFLG